MLKTFPGLIKWRRKHDVFRIIEALLYLLRTGCQWRMLPKEYPHWKSVYNKWRYWNSKGVFDTILNAMVTARRVAMGCSASPGKCFVDSATRRSGLSFSEKGIDGFKKIKGVKRHVAVDSNGFLLGALTTAANANDGKECLKLALQVKDRYRDVDHIVADKGYRGEEAQGRMAAVGIRLECVKSNSPATGFVPSKGRWVVERSFSWLDNYRRLARNYEQYLESATGMLVLAGLCHMLRYF